ncbi:MAG TPA: membrane protein insertion efficiency factor YidD [Thermoanaerobaculia bacterium]|nr:membrane protein insertion efficiency factor YidD [Thermoanaerobaculia bacterium]
MLAKRKAALLGLLLAIAMVSGATLVREMVVPVGQRTSTRLLLAAIDAYRSHASRHVGRVVQCRFEPSCSLFGREVIRRHGAFAGGWRAIVRIARCNPMTPMGTVDPPV